MKLFDYNEFVCRNNGYISNSVQDKIKNTKILIAGCGMGSVLAETATRLGFENFVLVDADTVSSHNLNRQAFLAKDIGKKKVEALADKILSINPGAHVTLVDQMLSLENVEEIISKCDIVLDTIDFLDLEGVMALHDECHRQKKTVISVVNAGWGAVAFHIPPSDEEFCFFRKAFGLTQKSNYKGESYLDYYIPFVSKISSHLDPNVINVMEKALKVMVDGKPCPASQLAPGSYSAGAMASTILVKVLAEEKLVEAPEMVILNLSNKVSEDGVKI